MALEAPPTWKEIEEDSQFQTLPISEKESLLSQWGDYSQKYVKEEGWDKDPEFKDTYDKWYARQKEAIKVDPNQFETKLSPEEETSFQKWKSEVAPNDPGLDYDYRGAFKAGLSPDVTSGHWPDTFKKPNHQTFSNESQYAVGDLAKLAGTWDGENFSYPDLRKSALQKIGQATTDTLSSVGRGVSDAYMGGSEGLYRAAGSTVAPFDRDEYLNQEARSAQDEIEKMNQNTLMIPDAREAGIRGQQERLEAAQNELRARQTEGTPEFQQRLEQQNAQAGSIGTTLLNIADEGGRLRQEVKQALPVSKEFESSLPGQIAQGLGQLSAIPLYAIPGAGPSVSIGQLYQEGYDDALRNGANPEQAREAAAQYTAIAAPLDIITDKLIVGRALKGMIGKSTVGEAVKDIAGIAVKEGAAEGGQQAALNLVASTLSGYDPDRPLTQDVLNSVLVGSIVGGTGATIAQTAGAASRPQQEANVVSTVIAENAASQAVVLLNNNAPQTAQAVAENAEQAINAVDRQARTLEILEDLDQEQAGLQTEVQGDERFAPPEPANVIRQAQIEADNLYSEDPDQAGQSSLRDWRLTLPPEVSGNIQAHGAPISELRGIVEQGIDQSRPFYTAPLNESGEVSLGLRDIGTGGQVLVLGAPGQDIKQSGVQAVVVNDYLAPSVSQLQEAYPNVTWLTTQNATQWLNEQQPTRLDEPITIPQGQAETPETGIAPEVQENPAAQQEAAKSIIGFHGTRNEFDKWDSERGGLINLAFEPNLAGVTAQEQAERYARGAGGGRASLNYKTDILATDDGNYHWSEEEQKFLPDNELPNAPKSLTIDQANTLIQNLEAELQPSQTAVMQYDVASQNPLDIRTREGMNLFGEALDTINPESLTFQQRKWLITLKSRVRRNEPIWDVTKWENRDKVFKDAVVPALKNAGYDGLIYGDDSHSTFAVFDPEQLTRINPNAPQAIQQQESVQGERAQGNQIGTPGQTGGGNRVLSETQEQVNEPERNDSGAIPETLQPTVEEGAGEPSQVAPRAAPRRVQIGSSPQTHEVISKLPQSPIEKELGERYFLIRNERTGAEQVVEQKDIRGVGGNLGPGAANIEEPVVQYEERSFGQRLDADESLDQTVRENIGDKYYSPIPNNVTAEQARDIVNERGIEDSIATIRDESSALPYHVRSTIGQIIIRRLNEQYAALKESNPQEAQRVLLQTVDLAEWAQDFGTRLGQGVQSFAMWSRLTPEGMLRTYQKGVTKARDRYEQQNPGEVEEIVEAINKAVPKDKPKTIDDLAKKGNKTAKKVKKATEKIIKAGKGKDLTSSEFYDAVSEELGLPKVSPEISTKILDLADKVTSAPEGIPKDRATLALTKYIATQKGFRPEDLPLGIFYGNILSGYNTHLVNLVDTLGNVNSEIFGLALTDPKAAVKIYESVLRGFSEGKADSLMALSEGRIATDEKWMDVPKLMEVAKFGTIGGVPIDTSTKKGQIAKYIAESKIATPLNYYKYVGRALAAADAFAFRGAKEGKAAQIAYKIATQEGKKGQELTDRMDEILGLNKMPNLLAQAKAEGFEGTQATARAVELREQLRDSGISDASSEFASEATYNHKPHGALGVVANGIESVSNTLLPLKLFVPFTRIVANVTNRSLNYTPYGYKRAFMGYTGEDAPIGDAKSMALARANIGTTALGVLAVLAAQGLIEINGAGPSDDEKRKQLQSAGWKPYSIRVGDNYINYLYTPIGLGLSVIGNMIDSQKYNELGNKDAATRAVYALGRIGSTVASQSFISGLSTLFRVLSESPSDSIGAIKSTISGTTSSFTTPTLVRDLNRLFDNRLYQSNSIAGDFIKNTPFAGLTLKPSLNALGDPVELPRQRFYTTLKDDPAWRMVAEKNLRISVPSKATAKEPGSPEPLSSTQYYHYLQESGKELKDYMKKNLSKLQAMDQEKAQETLDDQAQRIRKRILPKIRREKYDNP